MTNKHDHHVCGHPNMAYCRPCDAAYCKDCNREWPQMKYQYSGPYWGGSSPQSPLPYTVYGGMTGQGLGIGNDLHEKLGNVANQPVMNAATNHAAH